LYLDGSNLAGIFMPNIGQIQIGSEFELIEDIAISIGASLKSIISKYGGRLQLLNVPAGAPPDAPRIIATTQNFMLNFAPVRYDVHISVPTQIRSSYSKVMDYTIELFTKLGGELARLGLSYAWIGLIINLEYPGVIAGTPGIALSEPVFDRLLTIKRGSRKLAAFQAQFGFEEGEFNKIFTVSAYDSMRVKIDAPKMPTKFIRVDKETANIVESGLNVAIDVNNKPSKERIGLVHDFRSVAQASRDLYSRLPDLLNLKGIIANE
jgi:hypothetical protein